MQYKGHINVSSVSAISALYLNFIMTIIIHNNYIISINIQK